MQIEWKSVEGFEGLYEVSNTGEVKSLERFTENNGGKQMRREKLLKQRAGSHGHLIVVLSKDSKTYPRLVHRLVATAFIPNPDGKPVVDHIDTNPQNNNVNNLRWVTIQENALNPLTRKHNSESKKGHPSYYRGFSEETRAKISAALKGRKASEEKRAKLSTAHKNSAKSLETSLKNLEKAREANRGRHHSESTKEKIRDKLTGVHKGRHWKIVDGKRVWYD